MPDAGGAKAGEATRDIARAKALYGDMFDWLALRDRAEQQGFLDSVGQRVLNDLVNQWEMWAHRARRPKGDDWRIWMMMAGRGFGKTRTGAEWINGLAARHADLRIALVAASIDEARKVMVEGESGILARAVPGHEPVWAPTLGELRWPAGALASLYSGAAPDKLRGPQHHVAWCDELAKWARAEDSWNNLLLGMRLGDGPKLLVTTTPRPMKLLKRIMAMPDAVVTGGATTENPHLPPAYVAAMIDAYGGTRLGRQELDGELIEDVEGALWTRAMIERCRVRPSPRSGTSTGPEYEVPEVVRVVIGVDPPAGSGPGSDACGIVAVGLGRDGHGYVLGDASVAGKRPEEWAAAVAAAYRRFGADKVIAEKNQGGEMVDSVLRAAKSGLPVRLVHASRSKVARAEPVQMLYARGRVFHVGAFPELEDEMAGLTMGGGYEGPGKSPDRADALVWALSELMLGVEAAEPVVRVL